MLAKYTETIYIWFFAEVFRPYLEAELVSERTSGHKGTLKGYWIGR